MFLLQFKNFTMSHQDNKTLIQDSANLDFKSLKQTANFQAQIILCFPIYSDVFVFWGLQNYCGESPPVMLSLSG